jgi:hypothetical protein
MTILDRDDHKLAGFVFKGQLATVAVQRLSTKEQTHGELSHADIASKVSLKDLDQDAVALATKMSAVYVALATFENMVRELISTRLLEEEGADWWGKKVSADIRKRADRKIEDEKKIRWHKSRGLSPIYFTELGDLVSIIQQNWASFEALLPDIDWMRQIVRTVERSRNVIMHSGELSLDDIERIGVNLRDWVRQVGT